MTTSRVACAGGIVFDPDGRLLLIRRGTEPGLGRWSIPGGKCQPDESSAQACIREVAEETGLDVTVLGFAGRVERGGPCGVIFDIDDFVCRVQGGQLQAGDDASDARWVGAVELEALELVDGLIDALTEWGALPQ